MHNQPKEFCPHCQSDNMREICNNPVETWACITCENSKTFVNQESKDVDNVTK